MFSPDARVGLSGMPTRASALNTRIRFRSSRFSFSIKQNRPAAAEVFKLLLRILGSAKIDQIKVRAVELGVAKGQRRKDWLCGFLQLQAIGLRIQVVAIKIHAAAFASKRTADQAAAR